MTHTAICFQTFKKSVLCKCLFKEENVLSAFVIPHYAQCVLVSNTECKQKLCLFTRKLHMGPLSKLITHYALEYIQLEIHHL